MTLSATATEIKLGKIYLYLDPTKTNTRLGSDHKQGQYRIDTMRLSPYDWDKLESKLDTMGYSVSHRNEYAWYVNNI